ncbi:response regulator [Caballeronia humi]|uniref:Sensory/regulatory protein RpfC n=1 Tax=Caballeronia humi TaxID=326474 RepID=A0A158GAM4_9BURK|nr:response regulator [Caballeronia humi]SAL28937.1 multi-sensor hybrid histidine kinase [Caballeronia humi]
MSIRQSLTFRIGAFIVFVCLVLFAMDAWRSLASRRVQLAEMTSATANLARAMAQHANDTIKEADTTLIGIVERVEQDGTSPAALDRLHRSMVSRVKELPQLNGLFIYDSDGDWIVNSQAELNPKLNNADREYFIFHRTHVDKSVHIGLPVRSRSTGKWVLPVSRRLDGPGGEFAGVALATLDIDFFSRFYDSLDVGEAGATAFVTNGGIMVVRRPFEERFIGKNVTDTVLFRSHQSMGDSGSFISKSSQDGVTRLNSFRSLEDYPLFVSAALSRDEILASWWHDTLWHAIGTSLLVLVLAIFGVRLVRQVTARTKIEQELAASLETTRAILDTAVNPVITVDGKGAIRSFNRAAESVFGTTAQGMVGRNIRTLVSTGSIDTYNEYIRQFVGASIKATASCEVLGRRVDGSSFPAHVSTGSMDVDGDRQFVCVITDISQQKQERRELADARDQLLLAADLAELGIWSLDVTTGALQWNARMFQIYELAVSQLGRPLNVDDWTGRVHADDRDTVAARLQAALEGDAEYLPPFRIALPGDRIRYVQNAIRTHRDVNGNVVTVTGVSHDVTDQHDLELHLRTAKERADTASAAKSTFLANMSHEIRTPMNAVLGMLHLAQMTSLNRRQRDYVTNAETAAKSLLSLLNDILDYSKIEAGKLHLEPHPFEFETVMQDLGVVLAGNQGTKDVELLFDLDPRLPAITTGDSLRLQQVLINLAGNALKFTSHGQVVVSVKRLEALEHAVTVRISVSDSGIGISDEQLSRIFDGFTQAEASTSRRFGGSGLGLVICKRLIELMGSELKVESRLGEGSRFWFDVELGTEVEHQAIVHHAVAEVERPVRLLIVDDNRIAAQVLWRTITALGWEADIDYSGIDAVERIADYSRKGNRYDMVLMDWRMPDLDGLNAAKLINTQHCDGSPPVVMMITAYGREVLAETQDHQAAPFAGFLTKPVTPKQIKAAVLDALAGENVQRPTQPVAATRRSNRLGGLNLLVVEDNALNRQVAEGLLVAEGASVRIAESGHAGVAMVLDSGATFDAVLMDIQMPDLDGLEATRLIREDHRFAKLPVIAMTANASDADRQACLDAGMNDHVGKPIDVERLVAVLVAHAASPQERAEPVASNAVSDDALIEPRDSIIARFGGNVELIRSALSGFLAQGEQQLTQLAERVEAEDAPGSASILHAIKGASGTVGARGLWKLSSGLERELLDGGAIASVAENLAYLRQLLEESARELAARFTEEPTRAFAQPIDSIEPGEWQSRMQEILHLLESSNLQAISLSEALSSQTPMEQRPGFDSFLARVRALDFSRASAMARNMLEHV